MCLLDEEETQRRAKIELVSNVRYYIVHDFNMENKLRKEIEQ